MAGETYRLAYHQMFKEANCDREDWINKDAHQYFLTDKKFKNIVPNLHYIPDFLLKTYFTCQNGHRFQPAWLDKTYPLPPLRMRNGNMIVPVGSNIKCTHCDSVIEINFPGKTYNQDVFIFGDEAIREDKFFEKVLITYTMIASPRADTISRDFEMKFLNLKSELVKNVCPSKWVLHFKDLNDDRKRQSSKYFSSLSKSDVLSFAKKLGELIDSYPGHIVKWNCTSVFHKPKKWGKQELRKHKSLVFYPLFMRVVDATTSSGMAPRVHMEQSGDDGFILNSVLGGKCTLMWPFLTNCIPVANPIFEEPCKNIYYEIADFVSFIVARYLYVIANRAEGIDMEFDYQTEWLGKVFYMCTASNGTFHSMEQVGFPLEKFFNGTSWFPNKDMGHI